MIQHMTRDEIVQLVKKTPEQAVFDWKSNFTIPDNDDKRGEIIKDIVAIANAIEKGPGYIVYGVAPERPDPIVGVSATYDDSRLQQLVRGKVNPPVEFTYYEVTDPSGKIVTVIQVDPTCRPHVITQDIGKVRDGQIPIRRGSSTGGATIDDLEAMFKPKEFRIVRTDNPTFNRVRDFYVSQGFDLALPGPDSKDTYLEDGWSVANWPSNTRREVWIMNGVSDRPDHIFMVKPKSEVILG